MLVLVLIDADAGVAKPVIVRRIFLSVERG